MIAKVITKDNREYFSTVFALIGKGDDMKVIVFDNDNNRFQCLNVYERKKGTLQKRVFFTIDDEKKVYQGKERIGLIKKDVYTEFEWIIEYNKLLVDLANNKDNIEEEIKELAREINNKMDTLEWKYIKNESDIKELLAKTFNFKEAVISSITYYEDINDINSSAEIVFRGSWGNDLTMIIEHDILVHYVRDESYTNELIDANIFFEDGFIYWVEDDNVTEASEITPDLVYFRAKVFKWKFDEE